MRRHKRAALVRLRESVFNGLADGQLDTGGCGEHRRRRMHRRCRLEGGPDKQWSL